MKPRILSAARLSLPLAMALAATLAPNSLKAQDTATWTGSSDGLWSTSGNWSGGFVPNGNDVINIAGSSNTTMNNDLTGGALNQYRLLFNSGAGAFTLGGNALSFFNFGGNAPKIENNSSSTQTINLAVTLDGSGSGNAAEINPTDGNLAFGSTVDLAGTTQLRIWGNNGKTVTFDGIISSSGNGGANSLAINQNSTVIFGAANSYSGDTFINAGTLQFNPAGSANNSTIRLGDTVANSPAANFSLASGASSSSTIVVRPSSSGTQGIRSISSLATSGSSTLSGNLFLDADLTTSTLSGGTLAFTGTTFDLKNQTLNVGGTGATTISNALQNSTGSGKLTKSGTGTLTLSSANSYTGLTTITQGVLNIQNATALGTTAAGTSVTSGAALQIQGGITTGAEALALNGTGISNDGALRNISGTNTYGGLITLGSAARINSDAGLLTLDVASGNAITGTQNLTFGGAGDITVADIIATSSGTLTKDGAGILTLSAANTYTGLTTVNSGELRWGITNAVSSGNLTINNGGTVTMQTFNDTVGMVTLSKGGSITGTTGVLTTGSSGLVIDDGGSISGFTTGAVTLGGNLSYNDNIVGSTTATINRLYMSGNRTFTIADGDDASGIDLDITEFLGNGGSGNRNLIKDGTGVMRLSGTDANSLGSGTTTINDGTLLLNKSAEVNAIGGSSTITVGDSSGAAGSAILRYATGSNNNQIGSNNIVINSDGLFDLNGKNESAGTLTVNNTGQFDLNGATAVFGNTFITATGASSNTSAIINTAGNGSLQIGSLGITPVADYTSNINLNGANLILGGNGTFTSATTGRAQITGGTVTINANRTFNVGLGSGADYDLDIDAAIAQSGGTRTLQLNAGGGRLRFSGADSNTYGGLTTVSIGTLLLNKSSAAQAIAGGGLTIGGNNNTAATVQYTGASSDMMGTGTLTINGRGIFDFNGKTDTIGNVTIVSTGATDTNPTPIINTIGGGNLTIGSLTMNPVAGLTSVVNSGTGTLTLGGNVTFNAVTTGRAQISGTELALGASTRSFTVNLGTGADYDLLIDAGITGSGVGLTKSGAGRLTLSGTNTYDGNTSVSAGTLTLIGSLAGSNIATSSTGVLTQTSAGSISGVGTTFTQGSSGLSTLAGTNTYTGTTTVTAGTLLATKADALPGYNSPASVVINGSTAILGVQVGGSGWTTSEVDTLLANATKTSGALGIDTTNGDLSQWTAFNNTNLGTTLGLAKLGTGTLTLSSANGYAGGTIVNGGTLLVDNTSALGTGVVIVNTGGTLDLNSDLVIGGFTGAGIVNTGVSGPKTLSIGNGMASNASSNFTGVIEDGSGSIALTKIGTGTITLSGANTFSGGTTINAGTLTLDYNTQNNNKLSDTAVLTLGGGTLTLAGAAGTHTEVVASTTLTANSASNVTRSSGSAVLQLGTITNNIGSSINFGASGIATTNNTNNSLGILGYWATIGAGWAVNSTNGANGLITDATYTDVTRLSSGTKTISDGTGHVRIIQGTGTVGDITMAASGVTAIDTLVNAATSAGTVDIGTGNTLRTSAILQGTGAAALTMGVPGSAGTLTAHSAGGDLAIIANAGTNAITINSAIDDNTSASTLTKYGTGTLTLTSTASNYSGGTILNGGQINFSTDANLGDTGGDINFNGSATLNGSSSPTLNADRTVTINAGAVATINANSSGLLTVNGQLTGSGDLVTSGSHGVHFMNSNNTFTGSITTGTAGSTTYGFGMASIADEVGVGLINMGISTSGGTFRWFGASGGTKALEYRQFALSGTTGGGVISAFGSTANDNLVITQDLLITGVGNKTLTLAGTNTGTNTFVGDITDGTGSVISLAKSEGGTWALGGTNTYSGNTDLFASGTTGRLVFQGSQALSPNTKLIFAQNSSNVQSVSFLDDSSGMIGFNRPIEFGGTNSTQGLNIFVGNNNTANGGSSSGSTTGSTIQVGDITFTAVASDTNTTRINVTGANDYRLQIGTITLNNLTNRTAGSTTFTELNPTGANMAVAAITMAAGNAGPTLDGVPVLRLDGTTSDNHVTGAISESSVPLSLEKQDTSTWTLSGTGSTYSGTTTISGGTLIGIGANAFGSTSGISIAGAGTLSLRGDSNTSFVKASDSSAYGITTSASGATINVDQATIAGNGAKTMTIGGLGTSSTANVYQVNFTGANNTGLSLGAMSGPANASTTTTGTVTINNGIAGTGSLTLASYTSNNAGTGAGAGETLVFAGDGNTTVSGAITPSANPLALTKSGAGNLTLNGTSSYTGITTISSGVLEASVLANGGNNSSIGASSNASANLVFGAPTATFRYIGDDDITIDRGFTTSSTAGGGATIESSGTGTLSFGSTVAIAYQTSNQTRSLTLGGTNTGANTFGTVIADNGATGATSLTKTGEGTWILDQVNTYTGATTIDGGKLVVGVNSIGSITSNVTVNDGGTLGGSGTITGTLTVNDGGTHSVGNSPGVQTVNGATTYNSGSIFAWDLAANLDGDNTDAGDTGTRGTQYDAVNINSSLAVESGAIFRVIQNAGLDFADPFWEQDQKWSDIFSVTGSVTGWAANTAVAVFNLSNVNITDTISQYGSFTITGTTLNWQSSFNAIPEPTTALAGVLLTAGLLRRRRK